MRTDQYRQPDPPPPEPPAPKRDLDYWGKAARNWKIVAVLMGVSALLQLISVALRLYVQGRTH